ncbi:MAG: branched-chain amino acid ABC transporter permease [Acetobacteraceae bacterium]
MSSTSTAARELPRPGVTPRRSVLESPARAWLTYVAAMALTLAPMLILSGDNYWINIITLAYLFGGLATAWNIIGGFGGQFSAAHGVFFGFGAYFTARLYLDGGVSPWISMPIGGVLAAVIAVLISWPTFRLRGPFFAIATMAFNEVAAVFANYFSSVTGGAQGILVPFRAGFKNMIFVQRWQYALLMFGFLALTVLVSIVIRRSRLGYYLLAVREDEDTARAAGVNVLAVKLWGMAISALLTGMGGSLFTMLIRFIDPPTLFSLPDVGIKFALIALIGGIGTIYGSLLGAALVVPLENYIRATLGGTWPGAHLVVLGALLMLTALFLRRGIVGSFTRALPRWRARRA